MGDWDDFTRLLAEPRLSDSLKACIVKEVVHARMMLCIVRQTVGGGGGVAASTTAPTNAPELGKRINRSTNKRRYGDANTDWSVQLESTGTSNDPDARQRRRLARERERMQHEISPPPADGAQVPPGTSGSDPSGIDWSGFVIHDASHPGRVVGYKRRPD